MLWFGIVEHMKTHGINNILFHGFMADNAQIYWIGIRRVFGNGNPNKFVYYRQRAWKAWKGLVDFIRANP